VAWFHAAQAYMGRLEETLSWSLSTLELEAREINELARRTYLSLLRCVHLHDAPDTVDPDVGGLLGRCMICIMGAPIHGTPFAKKLPAKQRAVAERGPWRAPPSVAAAVYRMAHLCMRNAVHKAGAEPTARTWQHWYWHGKALHKTKHPFKVFLFFHGFPYIA
jgi:hypothetical protein